MPAHLLVVVAVVHVMVLYAVGRIESGLLDYGNETTRAPGPIPKLQLVQVVTPALPAIAAVRILDPGGAITGSLPERVPALLVWAVVNAGIATTIVAMGVLALVRGQRAGSLVTWPRRVTGEHPRAGRRRLATFVGVIGVMAFVEALLAPGATGLDRDLLYPVAWSATIAYLGLTNPLAPSSPSVETIREPTPDERGRIERAYERFDRESPWITVYQASERPAAIAGTGSPGLRSIWVFETALSAWSDDELAVGLAQADEHSRHFLHTYRYVALWLSGIAAFALWFEFAAGGALLFLHPFSITSLLGVMLTAYTARRVIHRGDQFAATALGGTLVRDVYASVGEGVSVSSSMPGRLGDLARDPPPVFGLLLPFVPMDSRLTRISET